jgi:hypothetical protein
MGGWMDRWYEWVDGWIDGMVWIDGGHINDLKRQTKLGCDKKVKSKIST